MEARRDIRPRLLRLAPGGDTRRPMDSDKDTERREVERVSDALETATENLPTTSPWLMPFVKAWRAIRDGLSQMPPRNG